VEAEQAAIKKLRPDAEDAIIRGQARAVNASMRQYTSTLMKRDALISALEQFFTSWDALLCPVAVAPAFPHCESGTPIQVDDQQVSYRMATIGYTCPFNLTGHPVVVMPLTRSAGGLPIGVQIVGRRWDDMRLLSLAIWLAERAKPFQVPPGYEVKAAARRP
jgi:amidase